MKIAAISLAVILVVFGSIGGYVVSTYNRAIDLETQIEAGYENLQNVKSNYTLKIREMIGVTDRYASEINQLVENTFNGRYGEDGSQATFQWIQENNIQLDSEMYKNIQVTLDSGRTDFQNRQTEFLDKKRIYEKMNRQFVSGFTLNLMGFPKINLDDYNIIVAKETREEFESGEDTAIQF